MQSSVLLKAEGRLFPGPAAWVAGSWACTGAYTIQNFTEEKYVSREGTDAPLPWIFQWNTKPPLTLWESRKEPTSCWATNPLNLGVHHPSGRSYTENFALPLSQLWQITGSARSQTKPSIAKSSSSTGERRASVQASLRNSFLKYFPSPGWSWYWFWSHGHNHSSLSIYAQRTAVAGFPGSPLCSPR